MKVYVIAPESGSRHLDLLEQIRDVTGLEPSLFPARMMSAIPDWYDSSLGRALHNLELLPGDIGCAMSHRDLYEEISRNGDTWSLIFEDDARIVDIDGMRTLIERVGRAPTSDPLVVSLYSEGAILREWPHEGLASCVGEPSFAVGYFINHDAAARLALANRNLGFCSDWPRASGVRFTLCVDPLIQHGDTTTVSLVGDRQTNRLRRPVSLSNLSVGLLVNRLALYSFVHYLQHRRHFSGPLDYYRKVLQHRVRWHLARIFLARRQVRPGIFVGSFRRRRSD